LKNVTSEPMARRRWEATKDVVNENCRISILATAGSIGIARHPIVVGPVEVDPAKLEFTFHSAQLRVGDRLDQVLQVAVDLMRTARGCECVFHASCQTDNRPAGRLDHQDTIDNHRREANRDIFHRW
jgi:hypothetical protein